MATLLPLGRSGRAPAKRSGAETIDATLSASRGASAKARGTFTARIRELAETAADIVGTPLAGGVSRRRWILQQEGDGFSLRRADRGRSGPIERVDPTASRALRKRPVKPGDAVELRLDPNQFVAQRLTLPGESGSFVEAVIDHRLDRLTPWTPEDVVYGYVAAPSEDGESLVVDFLATSRLIARDALSRAAEHGIRATALGTAAAPPGEPLAIDLLRGHGDERQAARRRRLSRTFLFALPAALACFLGSLWLQLDAQSRLDDATRQLEAQRRAVQARGAAAGADDPVRALVATKRLDDAAFHLIDRLAAIVPDDTFLTNLEIAPDSLRLKGSSADAPALVPVLEAESNLEAVHFDSPVVREAGERDRFDIVATRLRASRDAGQP